MNASAIPVLPEVASIMVIPGLSAPVAIASSIIAPAIRSFTLAIGLKGSAFNRILAQSLGTMCWRETSGVLPTVSWMVETDVEICMGAEHESASANCTLDGTARREICRGTIMKLPSRLACLTVFGTLVMLSGIYRKLSRPEGWPAFWFGVVVGGRGAAWSLADPSRQASAWLSPRRARPCSRRRLVRL